ncbi:glyoxalase I-like protein [Zea mays]|nr:glyoxalase I-like protein [Zea mays]ONM63054.1 glyoxalase I-like protein [Zea mays]ONM63055.1 glyoxalase I-like protein [Zea mays]ONM63056.1 glyoxalase I-like protein [Zea mays]ONM63057.1 glyoxalase I-like protein [Zea mays]
MNKTGARLRLAPNKRLTRRRSRVLRASRRCLAPSSPFLCRSWPLTPARLRLAVWPPPAWSPRWLAAPLDLGSYLVRTSIFVHFAVCPSDR